MYSIVKSFFNYYRVLLHRCFQALMDNGANLASILAEKFCKSLTVEVLSNENAKTKHMQLGFSLGNIYSHI